ncbi:MAG: serine/threonine protein kinase [Myxococcales bacterium]|nr:serine/threonine protein kinase [Myxococcales bacterium]
MSVDLRPGAIFAGDFRVVRPLSEGGMGAVYVVEQMSTGAQRALKLMRRELVADAALRDRFLQEARVGSRIASDHVVQVIAAGVEPAHNTPWLVMELLQGEELADRVRRAGPLSRAETAEVAKQLVHALAAAHAVGVVHRDLKPNNLFLATSRTAGAPFSLKVLDFGIAKIVADAQTTGTVGLGTPLWMAPEQTEAKSYVGPGTDVWAFGLIVFYILTGKSFWMAASHANTGIQTLLREILFEPIVPPSRRAAELGCGHLVPDGFDAWFLRCVERDPQRREASIERALAGLLPVLSGATAPAPKPPSATQIDAPLPFGHSAQAGSFPNAHPQAPATAPSAPPVMTAPTPYPPAPYPPAPYPPAQGPLVVTPPAPATSRRSSLGLVLAIGGVVLVGGGLGAYVLLGEGSKTKKRRSSSDDDEDEDEDRPRKKKSQPAPDKSADCDKLKAFMTRFETISSATDPDPPVDEQLADLAADAKAAELTTQEGRAIAARLATGFSELADAMERGQKAADRGDVQAAYRETENIKKVGESLQAAMIDLGLLCGFEEESP